MILYLVVEAIVDEVSLELNWPVEETKILGGFYKKEEAEHKVAELASQKKSY